MASLLSAANRLRRTYGALIKSRQTFLLTLTGAAGYLSRQPPAACRQCLAGLAGSLLSTISGCVVLNMVLDRDIDRQMERTCQRPLAAGQVSVRTAAVLGSTLLAVGLAWALALSTLYFVLVLAGAVGDLLVYTLWLKRRTAWSIFWGGLAGGLPILAGRALAAGRVDAVGLLLALSIVSWIPSHNMTLGMLYAEDYRRAGVPIFANVFGSSATSAAVAGSSVLTALLTTAAFVSLDFSAALMAFLIAIDLGLVGLAVFAWARPSRQGSLSLYRYSSIYMLAVMLLLALSPWLTSG